MTKEQEDAIKNLTEIIELCKEEIENNNKNITAILDLKDLRSLKIVLNLLKEKDKQIDLIVKELYKKAHISTKCYIQENIEECLKNKNCIECIKRYFERKVENYEQSNKRTNTYSNSR